MCANKQTGWIYGCRRDGRVLIVQVLPSHTAAVRVGFLEASSMWELAEGGREGGKELIADVRHPWLVHAPTSRAKVGG